MDAKYPTAANVDELIVAIQALQPVRNQAEAEFVKLYPAIKERLSKGVTQKAIRETLAMMGVKLHAQKFKKMLAAQEERVAQNSMGTVFIRNSQGNIGGEK